MAELKAAVEAGIAGVQARFGTSDVRAVPDGQGGAWVEIQAVELGAPYSQGTSFAVALLPFNLPAADIYPLFLRADLARLDGKPLGDGFSATQLSWPGDPQPRSVVQVSRRTRGAAFTAQTPVQKIEKVLDWVRTR